MKTKIQNHIRKVALSILLAGASLNLYGMQICQDECFREALKDVATNNTDLPIEIKDLLEAMVKGEIATVKKFLNSHTKRQLFLSCKITRYEDEGIKIYEREDASTKEPIVTNIIYAATRFMQPALLDVLLAHQDIRRELIFSKCIDRVFYGTAHHTLGKAIQCFISNGLKIFLKHEDISEKMLPYAGVVCSSFIITKNVTAFISLIKNKNLRKALLVTKKTEEEKEPNCAIAKAFHLLVEHIIKNEKKRGKKLLALIETFLSCDDAKEVFCKLHDGREKNEILQLTVREGFSKVVNYLLRHIPYTQNELSKANVPLSEALTGLKAGASRRMRIYSLLISNICSQLLFIHASDSLCKIAISPQIVPPQKFF